VSVKKTTTQVLEEREREWKREREVDEEIHRNSMEWMGKMMNAGLVSDVEPDGPMPTDTMRVTCGHCGADLEGPVYDGDDWLSAHISRCSR
jgi:hypothetical protein